MFCSESWLLPGSYMYTPKFAWDTITRNSKVPSDYEDFCFEGSHHLVSLLVEPSTHFLKCRHFSGISSWTKGHLGCLSPSARPQGV